MSEPKLLAIFDTMESGNFKQALKQIGQAEAKHSGQVLTAAKITCLQKTGQHQVAKALALDMLRNTDYFEVETTVQLMFRALRKMKLFNDAKAVLKRTHEVNPDNRYVQDCYALCCVAAKDWDALQKFSSQRHKKTKQAMYQLWSITSNLLQVSSDDPTSMLLLLSTKFLEKMLMDRTAKAAARDVLWLYVSCLKRMGKHEDALAFLGTEQAAEALPVEPDRLQFILEIFLEQKRPEAVNGLCRVALSEHDDERDDWSWWGNYFTSLKELVGKEKAGPAELPTRGGAGNPLTLSYDSTWSEATVFVQEMLRLEKGMDAGEKKPRRATRLARLHLLWLEENEAELVKGISEYLAWLKYKPQAHMDVAKFLPGVSADGVREMLRLVGMPDRIEESAASLRHAVASAKLRMCCGQLDDCPDAEVADFVQTMSSWYHKSAHLSSGLEWSEKHLGDDALQAASIASFHRYCRSGDARWLIQVLLTLEALTAPQNNTQTQLWQLLLPPRLGFRRPEISSQLDLKYVQLESLHYAEHSAVVSLEGPQAAAGFFEKVLNWHQHFSVEHCEISHHAWTNMFCAKVLDMEGYRRTIESSIQRREVAVELALTRAASAPASPSPALLEKLSNLEALLEPEIRQDDVTDNKDMEVLCATFLCAPHTERSDYLKTNMLKHTCCEQDLKKHRLPYVRCFFAVLQAVRAVVQLSPAAVAQQPAAPKKTKKQKGKAAPPSAAPAPASTAAPEKNESSAQDLCRAAAEALSNLPVESMSHVASEEMGKHILSVLQHGFTFLGEAAAPLERVKSLLREAEVFGEALKAACSFASSQTEPWSQDRFSRPRDVWCFLRQYPLLILTLRSLKLPPLCPGSLSALEEGLEAAAACLENVSGNARSFSSKLKKPPTDQAACAALLKGLAGAPPDADFEWSADGDAVVAFAGRVSAGWHASLKRISAAADESLSDTHDILAALAKN